MRRYASIAAVLMVGLSAPAMANFIGVSASNLASIQADAPDNAWPTYLKNVAPDQGEIDSLLTFDVSPYTGLVVDSDGTFDLSPVYLDFADYYLSTTFYLYSLGAPYSAATTWNSLQASGGYPNAADLLDTEPYVNPYGFGGVSVFFHVPEVTLQSWADSPSTNYGLIVIESNSWTSLPNAHSNIVWYPGSVLSFQLYAAPEPASWLLIAAGLAGMARVRSRNPKLR